MPQTSFRAVPGAFRAPALLCVLFLPLGALRVRADDRPGSALARLDFREVIQKAKDKVFPAVVFIKCVRESHEQGKKSSQEVSGSGVLVSAEGELVTNWHVVEKAVEVRCLLFDGRAYDATVVGTDKDTDLALVRLRRPANDPPLVHAAIGDSAALKEGDFVMAMGAPWGLSRSVSMGIVSCTRRFLPENGEYSLWLQTDAAISPGNSGGPLVNTGGEGIGINARGGDMGFAIPSDTFRIVIAQLREHGSMQWSWTGLQLQALRDFNRNTYFDAKEGVIVAGSDPESPARRAGLLARDRILSAGGTPLTALTEEDLPGVRRILGLLPKHQPAKFEVVRGDERLTVEITPREKGRVEGEELDCPRWDFTVKTINQFDNPDLHFQRKQGIFIFGVKSSGNAQSAGIRGQDILVSVDGREIVTLDDLKAVHKQCIDNVDSKHRAVVAVLRGGLLRQIVLDYSVDHEKQ